MCKNSIDYFWMPLTATTWKKDSEFYVFFVVFFITYMILGWFEKIKSCFCNYRAGYLNEDFLDHSELCLIISCYFLWSLTEYLPFCHHCTYRSSWSFRIHPARAMLSARARAMLVSSVHWPGFKLWSPPSLQPITGGKLPGGRNSIAEPKASPTAKPIKVPRKRSFVNFIFSLSIL